MLHETTFNATLLRQQHVTQDDFQRSIARAINNNVSIWLKYFHWDDAVSFPVLLTSLSIHANQSAPLGLLKRFHFVLSLLSSIILGTCPTKFVSSCRKRLVHAYRCHQDVLLVQMCRLERLHCHNLRHFVCWHEKNGCKSKKTTLITPPFFVFSCQTIPVLSISENFTEENWRKLKSKPSRSQKMAMLE